MASDFGHKLIVYNICNEIETNETDTAYCILSYFSDFLEKKSARLTGTFSSHA